MACYQHMNMAYQHPATHQYYGMVTPTSPNRPAYSPVMTSRHQQPLFHYSTSQMPMQQPSPVDLPPAHVLQYLSPPPSASPCSPASPRSFTQPSVGRAVVIGINYFNQKGEMKGRVDEARNLSQYLEQVKRYRKEDIILLTDDQNGTYGQPTKKNILGALIWLVKNAQPGEKMVLYYSGHGRVSVSQKQSRRSSKAKAANDDEGKTIYPVDFRSFKDGMISPQDLEEILSPLRQKGARLTMILDTHAGVKS